MSDSIKQLIAKTFKSIASGLETGSFGSRPVIAVTGLGSEHGEENVMAGAVAASAQTDVIYIGTLEHPNVTTIKTDCEKKAHEIMEELLHTGKADGAVTMHYPFPIGVSTVGKAVTPGRGKEMYIATTTGTSATDRTEGMIRNAIYGVICAKACGNANPTVGILNVDSARAVELALKELAAGGYGICLGSSGRADGGSVLRGNDVLTASCDVLVTDPLTGNILVKMLSSFSTGGSYESLGSGYGPGIGKGYNDLIMIVSRASGAPVIANSIIYAADLVRGGYCDIAAAEFAAAEKAGLAAVIEKYKAKPAESTAQAIKAPDKEIVTEQISGIEITALEDAVAALWKNGIYAESGMGCTGAIILVNEKNIEKARAALAKEGWIGG